MYPCSLEDSRKCASPQELRGLRVFYSKVDKLLTSADYHSPVALSPVIRNIRLTQSSTKYMKVAVRLNKVIDDKYEFVAPNVRKSYSSYEVVENDINPRDSRKLHCTKGEVALWYYGGCFEYLSVVYEPLREVFITRRSYKRITVVFGEFGGILKLLTTVVFFFYSWYNVGEIRGYLGDVIYGYNRKTRDVFGKVLGLSEAMKENGKNEKGEFEMVENRIVGDEEAGNAGEFEKGRVKVKKRAVSRPDGVSTIFKRNDKVKKQKADRVTKMDRVIRSCVKSRTSTLDLVEKLNFIDFLQQMLLEDHHKLLLPLTLVKAKHQRLSQAMDRDKRKEALYCDEDEENNRFLMNRFQNEGNSNLAKIELVEGKEIQRVKKEEEVVDAGEKIELQEEGRVKIFPKKLKFRKRTKIEVGLNSSRSRYKNAYKALKDSVPGSNLEISIKDYIIKIFGSAFEENLSIEPKTQKEAMAEHRSIKTPLKRRSSGLRSLQSNPFGQSIEISPRSQNEKISKKIDRSSLQRADIFSNSIYSSFKLQKQPKLFKYGNQRSKFSNSLKRTRKKKSVNRSRFESSQGSQTNTIGSKNIVNG